MYTASNYRAGELTAVGHASASNQLQLLREVIDTSDI